ncbi:MULTISPECIES: hypothetical protein [Hyphomonas]|uniref:hypothetical protein n=1 Tax=Hyphomonas TaxID=85 RepID=UPI0038996E12
MIIVVGGQRRSVIFPDSLQRATIVIRVRDKYLIRPGQSCPSSRRIILITDRSKLALLALQSAKRVPTVCQDLPIRTGGC